MERNYYWVSRHFFSATQPMIPMVSQRAIAIFALILVFHLYTIKSTQTHYIRSSHRTFGLFFIHVGSLTWVSRGLVVTPRPQWAMAPPVAAPLRG